MPYRLRRLGKETLPDTVLVSASEEGAAVGANGLTYSLKKSEWEPVRTQGQFLSFSAANQEPVRLDMSLPVTLPNPPERMVTIASGQRFLLNRYRPQLTPDRCLVA